MALRRSTEYTETIRLEKGENFQILREVVANVETCELRRENAGVYRAYLYTGVSEKEIKSLHENNGIY